MTVAVSAPATTANLGSGFDCVALALDLWNELEVEPGEFAVRGGGRGRGRARDSICPTSPCGRSRWPRARPASAFASSTGSRSSAGSAPAPRRSPPGTRRAASSPASRSRAVELPDAVVELDGHADNLAAAFSGGACLTWADAGVRQVRRLADGAPLEAVAVIPASRGHTATLRGGLPASVAHETAAVAAGRAALLGAALATGDVELFVQLDGRRPARALPDGGVAPLRGAEGRPACRASAP